MRHANFCPSSIQSSVQFFAEGGTSARYAIMAGCLLKTHCFTCHWISKPGIDCRQHLSAIQRVITSCSDLHFAALHMSDVHHKPSEDICEDPMQQVSCDLAFATAPSGGWLERVSAAIASHWCLTGLTNPSALGVLQWLEPDRTSGFWLGFVPLEADIPLLSISFGAYVGLTTFAKLYSIAEHTQDARFTLDCTLKHDEKVLYVCIRIQHTCKKTSSIYRLTLKYDDIYRVVIDSRLDSTDVYLHVKTVPLLHKQVERSLEDILLSKSHCAPSQTCELMKFERTLDAGCTCTSYLRTVDFARCPVMKLCMADKRKARRAVGRLSHRCRRDVKFVYAPVVTSDISNLVKCTKQKFMAAVSPLLQFSCRYSLNAVFQRSHDILAQMALLSENDFDAFISFMQSCARVDESALEQVLFALCSSIENGGIFTLRTALPILFNRFHTCHTSIEIPGSCYWVRRIIATPSNLFLLPPEVNCKNRVLRSFDPDYALRVTFRDDNLDYLSHSLMLNQRTDEILEATVAAFLRKGVFIAGRHYRYLGSSTSQLRDHGAWLYAKDGKGKSVQDIRTWMGDVAHIPNVGYKMARMGQCFSATEDTVRVPTDSGAKRDLSDIVGGKHPFSGNPYIFSDGIGMISESLMTKVCEQLGLTGVPSAIQIRYAGYKGILCLNPELQEDQLLLRESMNKFHCSTSDSLEIVRVSAPCPVFLNRPLITILEQLGVPARVFVRLQQTMVLQLCDAFVRDDIALQVLYPHLNSIYLPLGKLHHLGLALNNELFVRSLLLAVYNSAVAGLKNKSHIAVPEDTGRNMLGVLDETGTLEYGQVFVQFSDITNNERALKSRCTARVITGTVMVTKCPCLHPGDVRKFEAVDVPALHHIRDCIVFPAKGQRPHPDEMAGSDLDGDEYVVIAEKDLFFPGENVEPMVFNDQVYKADGQQDLDEDMISFTCNFIKNDNVGLMSSAHLAWADQLPDGIFSPRCLSLAKKISTSLDFAKTGISACLDKSERVYRYPEFMEKTGNKDTYQSSRVLGQLYRLNRGLVSSGFCGCAERRVRHNLFEFPGWQKYEWAAMQAKRVYADIMSQILRSYGISSEAEIVTGLLNSLSPHHSSRNFRRNVEANIQKQFQKLVETMRQHFFRDVELAVQDRSLSGMSTRETLLQMGSAWYMVARSASTAISETNCQGFPWCISDVLLVLLRSKRAHHIQTLEPQACDLLLEELNGAITNSFDDVPARGIALNTLLKWASKEDLLTKPGSDGPGICVDCLSSLFVSFANSDATTESSPQSRGRHHCAEEGSDALFGRPPQNAAAYVMAFLRHLAHAPVLSPLCFHCQQPCSQAHTLTLAALRCYSQLVVCGSPCHLGLPFSGDRHRVDQLEEHGPIRVQVRSAALLRLLREDGKRVEETLRRWSSAQAVRIRLSMSRSGRRHCALVSARGRDWQMWFLEELLLQPWFEQAIVSGAAGRRRPRH